MQRDVPTSNIPTPNAGLALEGPATDQARVLTVAETAAALKLSVGYTRRLVRKGVLPSLRIGGAVRISVRALTAYVEQHSSVPVPAPPHRFESSFDLDACIASERARLDALTDEERDDERRARILPSKGHRP